VTMNDLQLETVDGAGFMALGELEYVQITEDCGPLSWQDQTKRRLMR